ncbi:MAG: hypothetical protein WDA41_10705 [Candidatus Neomarinimicrobiota bacterium]
MISISAFTFWLCLSAAVCGGFLLAGLCNAAARSAKRRRILERHRQSNVWLRGIGRNEAE